MALLVSLKVDCVSLALRWRQLVLVMVVSVVAVLLSGSINISQVKLGMVFFGLQESEEADVRDRLKHLNFLEYHSVSEADPYVPVLKEKGAVWGVSMKGDELVLTSADDHNDVNLAYTYSIVLALSNQLPDSLLMEAQLKALTDGVEIAPRQKASTYPPSWRFPAKIIALLVVLLPFYIAIDLYARDARSEALLLHLAAREGALLPYAISKLCVSVFFAGIVLLVLLLVVQAVFGLSPKAGLFELIAVQLLAAAVSAGYGLIMVIAGGRSKQSYGLIAAYFLALIVFGGLLFPTETLDWYFQIFAPLFPLHFSMPVMENWLIDGLPPFQMTANITYLILQAVAVVIVLTLSTAVVRRFM